MATPGPTSCPVCGETDFVHSPETAEMKEFWVFECGLELNRHQQGWLAVDECCFLSTFKEVVKLNEAAGYK